MNWTIFLRQERKENINQRIQEIGEETEGEEDLSGKSDESKKFGVKQKPKQLIKSNFLGKKIGQKTKTT